MSAEIAMPLAITTTGSSATASPLDPSSTASNGTSRQTPDTGGTWTQTFSPKTLQSALKPPLLAARADDAPKEFKSAFDSAPIMRRYNSGDTARYFESRHAFTEITEDRDSRAWKGYTMLREGGGAARNLLAGSRQRADDRGLDDYSSFDFTVKDVGGGSKEIVFDLRVRDKANGDGFKQYEFRTTGPLKITRDGFLNFSGKTWTPNELENLIESRGDRLGIPGKQGGE